MIVVGRRSLEEPGITFELLAQGTGSAKATEASQELLGAAFAPAADVSGGQPVRSWNAPSSPNAY